MIVQKKYKNEGVETMAKKILLIFLVFSMVFPAVPLTAEEKLI